MPVNESNYSRNICQEEGGNSCCNLMISMNLANMNLTFKNSICKKYDEEEGGELREEVDWSGWAASQQRSQI